MHHLGAILDRGKCRLGPPQRDDLVDAAAGQRRGRVDPAGLRVLAGRIVATTAGSSGEVFAREVNARLIAEHREPMTIHAFANHRDTHFPVSMGHAAAYFIATRSALVPSLDPDSRVRLVAGAFRPRRQVGFALRAGDRDLRNAIEHAIAAKVANGAYDRLRARHGLPDELSPFR